MGTAEEYEATLASLDSMTARLEEGARHLVWTVVIGLATLILLTAAAVVGGKLLYDRLEPRVSRAARKRRTGGGDEPPRADHAA